MNMLLTPWVSLVLCWQTQILSLQLVYRVIPSFLTSACGPRSSSQTQPPQLKVLCSQDLCRSCGSLSLCVEAVLRGTGAVRAGPPPALEAVPRGPHFTNQELRSEGQGQAQNRGFACERRWGPCRGGSGKGSAAAQVWASGPGTIVTCNRCRDTGGEQGPRVECGRMQLGLQSRLSPSLLLSSLSLAP